MKIPDEFENLQILPKDIDNRELVSVMRGFAGALGKRCSFCHVGGDDPNSLQGMDFATDEREQKKTARAMMQMVNDINENHLGKLDRESPLKVQCVTCHHGVEKPETIDSIMLGLIDSEGLEAASARYEEPREEYYGSGAYNFDAGPLNAVAEELARGERLDEAVRVMEMNIEFHSGESHPHVLLAQIHVQRGEKEAAIASLERALEIDPDNGWARGMLERVRTGD